MYSGKLLMMDRRTVRNICQNKFVKLVHLVGFIIKKFVTMHGNTNVKKTYTIMTYSSRLVSYNCKYGLPISYFDMVTRPPTSDYRIEFTLVILHI